eukprot:2600192-Prymnesium_polylepis.1
MADGRCGARGRYRALRAPCGASGTRYPMVLRSTARLFVIVHHTHTRKDAKPTILGRANSPRGRKSTSLDCT